MPTPAETASIKAIAAGIGELTEKAVTTISLEVTANLKQDPHTSDTGTPVDTGWARGNWIPSVGRPVDEPVGSPDNVSVAANAQAQGEASLLSYRLQQGKAWVVNNVPYIAALNDGHSFQQGAGFVQRSIAKALRVAERIRG